MRGCYFKVDSAGHVRMIINENRIYDIDGKNIPMRYLDGYRASQPDKLVEFGIRYLDEPPQGKRMPVVGEEAKYYDIIEKDVETGTNKKVRNILGVEQKELEDAQFSIIFQALQHFKNVLDGAPMTDRSMAIEAMIVEISKAYEDE